MTGQIDSRWHGADAYERYMGRWSRKIAAEFLRWLDPRERITWLDVGCGTGALTTAILDSSDPVAVTGIDPSTPFIEAAREAIRDPRVSFQVADAQNLPLDDRTVDASVSGLCLNFIPDPTRAAAELVRVTRPGGIIASYVWDYVDGMQMMRYFWDAATAIDPDLSVDEGHRNPLCAPEPLRSLFAGAGLKAVEVASVEIEARFADFIDYWTPFDGGTGPAPAYLKTLEPEARVALATELCRILPFDAEGSIPLRARAWAIRGVRT